MIVIGKPYIEEEKEKTRLVCEIKDHKGTHNVYLEVAKEYGKYLCYERCDAFLIVLFFYAMREKQDIVCSAPVSEDLYYQITEYLVPLFAKASYNHLNPIHITCKTASNMDNIGAVGTGITCGVDSFYTIFNNINHKLKSRQLTHLVIMSLADSYKNNGKYDDRTEILYNKAELIAKELALPVIKIKSNMRELFPIPPMHTLIRMYGIYALQKLFGVYYFASGYPLWTFNLEDCSMIDSARYDLLLCKELSTRNLVVYSDGSQKTRIEKLNFISKFPLAQHNLHVCVKEAYNCCHCSKCVRTIIALDTLNKLDEYQDVFDVKDYYQHQNVYFKELVKLYEQGDIFIYEYIEDLVKKYPQNKILKQIQLPKVKGNICNYCYRKSDAKISSKKIIIGITGGSSSGKSTVTSILKASLENSVIISIDKYMIKYLDVYKKQIIDKLHIIDDGRHWCNYIYNSFNDVTMWVNLLKGDIEKDMTEEINNSKAKIIIIDSFMLPLLDIYNNCYIKISVSSLLKKKLPRLKQRLKENGRLPLFDEIALKKRLKHTALSDKLLDVDFQIKNNGSLNDLNSKVGDIIEQIKKDYL